MIATAFLAGLNNLLRLTPASMTLKQTTAWLLDPVEPGVRALALIHLEGRNSDDREVKNAQADSLIRGSISKVLNGLDLTSGRDSYDSLFLPRYGAPYHRLIALADLGAPHDVTRINNVLEKVLDVFAKPDGGFGNKDSHVCITGNIVRAAIHFGRGEDPRVKSGIEWLLANQRDDGGWNCFPEDEPNSTVDSWEPLAALGTIPEPQQSLVSPAIERGVEFFLEQHLGVDKGYEPWRRIHFPRHYYYDFLLGLELVTSLSDHHDSRLNPAVELLLSKKSADGKWPLDDTHPDVDPEGDPPYKPIYAEMMRNKPKNKLEVEPPGLPSRWATLAAIRILQRVRRTE
jgi:hypothetical protein